MGFIFVMLSAVNLWEKYLMKFPMSEQFPVG